MSALQTIEIEGNLVGILSADQTSRSFYFHSGIAPYDLLDGSRFSRVAEARAAIERMDRLDHEGRAPGPITRALYALKPASYKPA